MERADTNLMTTPVQVSRVTARQICAGGYFTLAQRSPRQLTFWGMISGAFRSRVPAQIRVPGLSDVKQLACGGYHALVLTDDGFVYGMGRNEYSQLALGHHNLTTTLELSPFFVVHSQDFKVVHVSAGAEHSVALTDSGVVFGWGSTELGQLGLPAERLVVEEPRQLFSGHGKILDVCAGGSFTVALTASGKVLAMGASAFGQLGSGLDATKKNYDHEVNEVVNLANVGIIALSCGGDFAYAFDNMGNTYSWGWGEFGQLGSGTTDDAIVATPVLQNHDMRAASGGYAHSLFLERNTLYVAGWNKRGQAGIGHRSDVLTPTVVEGLSPIVSASAGFKHSAALDVHGAVFVWGDNSYFQLGQEVHPMTLIERGDYDDYSYTGKKFNRDRKVEEARTNAVEMTDEELELAKEEHIQRSLGMKFERPFDMTFEQEVTMFAQLQELADPDSFDKSKIEEMVRKRRAQEWEWERLKLQGKGEDVPLPESTDLDPETLKMLAELHLQKGEFESVETPTVFNDQKEPKNEL